MNDTLIQIVKIKMKNKIILAVNYLCRVFLIWVLIAHGWEKLTIRINTQEYISYGLDGDFLDFYQKQ